MRTGRRLLVLGGLLVGAASAVAAMASDRGAPPDTGVLLVRVADGGRERLTRIGGSASWSDDARRVFVSDLESRRFAVFADGRRVLTRRLGGAEVAGGEVALSPAERRIAYVARARDPRDINTGDLVVGRLRSGRPERLLTRATGTPAWSADGAWIAVERDSVAGARALGGERQDPERIHVVRSTRPGAVMSAGRGRTPTWLPDGRLIFIARSRRSTDLVVARPDGRARRTVLRDVRGGTWKVSPDGRHVAVAAAGQGVPNPHVTIVDLSGAPARTASDEPASAVAWSPGGDQLAATVRDRLVIIDASGRAPARSLVQIPGRDLGDPAWSPDGSRIAVSAAVHEPHRD